MRGLTAASHCTTRRQRNVISGDAWKCRECGKGFVVQGLARDCERRHRLTTAVCDAFAVPRYVVAGVPGHPVEPVWPKLWNLAHAAEELAVIEAGLVALARLETGKRQ